MTRATRWTRGPRLLCGLAILAGAACGRDPVSVAVTDTRSQTVRVPAGADFSITLGTVGPGSYPVPSISAAVVRYVSSEDVGPPNPGGIQQRFHFNAAGRGQAILTFTPVGGAIPGSPPTIQDTVQVY